MGLDKKSAKKLTLGCGTDDTICEIVCVRIQTSRRRPNRGSSAEAPTLFSGPGTSQDGVVIGGEMESSLALVVMPKERRRPLLHSLESLNFETLLVGNCTEARHLLQTAPPVQVVITQVSLPDGNWCDVLRFLVDSGMEASVVVTSPQADENLWSEVLWRGAYDLLIEPFETDEVRRTMEGALRARRSRVNRYSDWAAAGRRQ